MELSVHLRAFSVALRSLTRSSPRGGRCLRWMAHKAHLPGAEALQAGRARAGHCSGAEADQSAPSLLGLEQSPRGEHLFQDEGLERESVRLGESCRPAEGEARRELGLPPVQLEGGRGGVLDR